MFKFCWISAPPLILISRLGIGSGPLSKLIGRMTGKPEIDRDEGLSSWITSV